MSILRVLSLYKPFHDLSVKIVQSAIRIESARHSHDMLEYIKCLRFCKGEESYIPTFIKDIIEYNNCSSRFGRCIVGLMTFPNDFANLCLKIAKEIVSSLSKIVLFYYDLVKDMVILESLFFIDQKILLDEETTHKYESVGGLDFQLLAYYLIAIFVSSELAIYILIKIRQGVFRSCFRVTDDMPFLRTIISAFPVHFTILEQCRIHIKMAYLEHMIIRTLNDLDRMEKCTEKVAGSIEEFANEFDELEKQLHHLNNLECEIQIIETCLEREPQLIVQISLFILMNRFSRIKLLFEDSIYGIPLDYIMIVTIGMTLFSMVSSIKRFRDRKKFPNTSGIMGTIIHLTAIVALLVPKLLLISFSLIKHGLFASDSLFYEYVCYYCYEQTFVWRQHEYH